MFLLWLKLIKNKAIEVTEPNDNRKFTSIVLLETYISKKQKEKGQKKSVLHTFFASHMKNTGESTKSDINKIGRMILPIEAIKIKSARH